MPDERSNLEKVWTNKWVRTGFVLLIIFGIIFYVYSLGRQTIKDNQKKIPQVKIDNDGSIDDAFKEQSVENVKEIFRVTDGVDWISDIGVWQIRGKHFEAKKQIYSKLLKMSRPQIFYVYNLYNLTYYPSTAETMVQAIVGDKGGLLITPPENEAKLIEKLKALKLP